MKKLSVLLFFMGLTVFWGIGGTAFAEEATHAKAYKIQSDMTMADIIEMTAPNEYNTMPEEIKNRFRNKNAIETLNNETVVMEPRLAILLIGQLGITFSNVQYTSFSHQSVYAFSQSCPYIFLETFVYDAENQLLIDSESGSEFNSRTVSVFGTTTGLQAHHRYKVTAVGDAVLPAGYYGTGEKTYSSYITTG